MKTALYIIFFTLSAFVATAQADNFVQFKGQEQCRPVSKGAAMSAVARGTKNKVLSASLNMRAKPPIYRVKTISKTGRVRTYRVNACTGQLLG